jgi:hypothetical protein
MRKLLYRRFLGLSFEAEQCRISPISLTCRVRCAA